MRILQKTVHIPTSVFLTLSICLSAADGATIFSDSLKGGSLPGDFNLADAAAGRAPTYDGAGVTFAGDGDNARNYLRTNDTDYHTVSFTAYITVATQLGTSFNNDTQFFFGIGTGDVGDFGIADMRNGLTSIALNFNSEDAGAGGFSVNDHGSYNNRLSTTEYSGVDDTQPTITAIRMIYDAAGETIQFDLDYEYAGNSTYAAFSTDQSSGSVDISSAVAGWVGGDKSAIYFGGDSDNGRALTVSDFTIVPELVPEPSIPALIGLAGLMLLTRRHR